METEALEKSHRLSSRVRSCEREQRTIWLDTAGAVRRYQWDAGGEDGGELLDYYYDAEGHLRFLHSKGMAAPSATRETRVWFDARGNQLWTTHAFHGEGPDLRPLDYPEYVVREPLKHFDGKPIYYQGPDACEITSHKAARP